MAQASRKESFAAGRGTQREGMCLQLHFQDFLHTLIDLHRPLCVIWVLCSKSEFTTGDRVGTVILSSAVQVCGVPHPEVQAYGQTFGGPPAGLQPRSVPGAPTCGRWQNHLVCRGLRLVLLSLATGTFAHTLIQNCQDERLGVLQVFQLTVSVCSEVSAG